ncbi:MAG: SDR family oxidoreductase [Spirochaetia bacterium]
MKLTNTKAFITGVSRKRGIGYAVAEQFLKEGADVFLQGYPQYDEDVHDDRNSKEDLLGKLREIGPSVEYADADLSGREVPKELMEKAYSVFDDIDIMVMNHAYSTEGKLEELTPENIDTHMQVNVRAMLLLLKEWSLRRQKNGGSVILLTSGQHMGPMTGELSYAASKGAIHQLTRSLSSHFGQRNIRVNAVNPGPTDTINYKAGYPELYNAVLEKMPFGRWGEPGDAARLITWLASQDAKWITGQIINSDGGFEY